MLRRRMRRNQARRAIAGRLPSTEEVRNQVAEVTDELGEALEVAKDAIAKAMTSAGRRGTEAGAEATRKTAMLGKEAGRKGMVAGKRASRRARGATLDAVGRRLPEPELATEKVFPERAKHHRKTVRKRRRRLMYGGAGLAAIGMLIGWLTAPKKGDETRQALKERANAASDKVAEMRATAGPQRPAGTSTTSGMVADSGVGSGSMAGSGTSAGMPATGADTGAQDQQGADVTPIHQADNATATKRR